MRVGVMGGTFDPVHHGHLASARELRARFALDEVRLVPAGLPPHKAAPEASAAHRFAMVVLATLDVPGVYSSAEEVEAGGTSYTIDTIRRIQRDRPAAEVFFIAGIDAFREITTWREADALLELCHFLVTSRPGTDLELPELPPGARRRIVWMGRDVSSLPERGAPAIYVVEVAPVRVSATEIRRAVGRGEPIGAWVPPTVERYIHKMGLYGAARERRPD